jgi:hypothetical protein
MLELSGGVLLAPTIVILSLRLHVLPKVITICDHLRGLSSDPDAMVQRHCAAGTIRFNLIPGNTYLSHFVCFLPGLCELRASPAGAQMLA